MTTSSFIMTSDGRLEAHSGAVIDDAASALAALDAAVARLDWASVVKLEPSVGSAIDAAAVPAYGSNVAQAATLAESSQGATQAAWATNTALAAQLAAGVDQSEMASSAKMISSYLHQALSDAQKALSALNGGGMPSWLPWAGLGALAALALAMVARSRRPSPASEFPL